MNNGVGNFQFPQVGTFEFPLTMLSLGSEWGERGGTGSCHRGRPSGSQPFDMHRRRARCLSFAADDDPDGSLSRSVNASGQAAQPRCACLDSHFLIFHVVAP
jgi:hypothetical protein